MEPFREQEQRFMRVRDLLERGVYHGVRQLRAEAWISPEPLPFERRTEGRYLLLEPGMHWGDLFDCAWVHFTGEVPEEALGRHLAVLVDLSAEGLVVDEAGYPVQGLTTATSRNEFPLGLWGKRTIPLDDCLNHKDPFKAEGNNAENRRIDFWADFTCCDVEGQYRNHGRMREAVLSEVDDECRAAFYDWVVAESLFVGLCENGLPYGEEVGGILERAYQAAIRPGVFRKEEGTPGSAPGNSGLASENQNSTDGQCETALSTEERRRARDGYFSEDPGLVSAGEQISIRPDTDVDPTWKTALRADPEMVREIRSILSEILEKPNEHPDYVYSAIGHSHLDLLFLWPERETVRKCARTLSTVMKMMRLDPSYQFSLSQVPVFIWMKEHYPALYAEMLQRIRERRLEPVGSFYIECDTNLPGGESLVRQLLYGKRWFLKELGLDMEVGFLPDCFGFSAALPQLLKKSRVPYFLTNKLSFNDTNRFPRYTFWWIGMDGSKVLTHMLPENSYTSAAVPQMALYGQYHDTDRDLSPRGIELYGLGDGGGGPGYEHMERRKRTRNLQGCPPFEDGFITDFFHRIEEGSERYRNFSGELYLERHQGTFTSIAHQKKWNRVMEKELHLLEYVSALADGRTNHGTDAGDPSEENGRIFHYPRKWLEKAWQDVMLYQFHDCLPGSAIPRVYKETRARYKVLYREAEALIRKALSALLGANGTQRGVLVNPSPFPKEVWLKTCPGREQTARKEILAPYEIRVIRGEETLFDGKKDLRDLLEEDTRDQGGNFGTASFAAPEAERAEASLEARFGKAERPGILALENDLVRLVFTERGTISSLYDKTENREFMPDGREGNDLRLYPDELTHWDINKDYLKSEGKAPVLSERRVEEHESETLVIQRFRLGKTSELLQKVHFRRDSARVDLENDVDWREEYQMLRVRFPADIRTDHADCGIQFGHVPRPTHTNTSWDEAKFEVPIQRYVDLSDASGGIALLTDYKNGCRVNNGGLDLCLLRSQNCPAEHGDIGRHIFTYAVFPHTGTLKEGGVIREAYDLETPVFMYRLPASLTGASGVPGPENTPAGAPSQDAFTPFSIAAGTTAVLETIKKAEDREELILRFYEAAGGPTEAEIRLDGYEALGLCNLLEEPEESKDYERTAQGARIRFHAFEIQSLRVRKA